jgi:large subunit ribosomal protein L15
VRSRGRVSPAKSWSMLRETNCKRVIYCELPEYFPVPMAMKSSTSSARPLLELFHPARRRQTCPRLNQFGRPKSATFSRNVSTAAPQQSEMEVETESRPRWAYTPPAMAAPVRSRLPRREEPWKVNEDPKKLDSVYVRFLGPGGEKMLTDETKWLAVTHKSFDHGRRGFNDRLSYLGRLARTLLLNSEGSD